MATYVGRVKSVVMREAKRLGKPEDYDPDKAQADFEAKQKLIGTKKKTEDKNNKPRKKNAMDRRKRKVTSSRTKGISFLQER